MRVRPLFRAVQLALLLLGLVWPHLPHTAPGAARAESASGFLVPTTLPVNTCPGFPPSLSSSATEVSVQVPSDVPDSATSLQAWGSPSAILLGPADFSCIARYGSADGGLFMTLFGPDDPCYSQPDYGCPGNPIAFTPPAYSGYIRPATETDRVTAVFNPGGAGAEFDLACPYFPWLQALQPPGLAQPLAVERGGTCLLPLPPGQAVQQLDANSVAFYQPADDTHANPTFGIVVTEGEGGPEATCTLPGVGSSMCRSILIAFLTGCGRYGPCDPAADSAAMALDTLSWFAANSSATPVPAPPIPAALAPSGQWQVVADEGGAPYQIPFLGGLALDGAGNTYVLDGQFGRILKLGPDGAALAQWDGPWASVYPGRGAGRGRPGQYLRGGHRQQPDRQARSGRDAAR